MKPTALGSLKYAALNLLTLIPASSSILYSTRLDQVNLSLLLLVSIVYRLPKLNPLIGQLLRVLLLTVFIHHWSYSLAITRITPTPLPSTIQLTLEDINGITHYS